MRSDAGAALPYENVVSVMLDRFPELVAASDAVAADVRQFGDIEADPLDPYTQVTEVFVERYLLPALETRDAPASVRALRFLEELLASGDERVSDLARIRVVQRIRSRRHLKDFALEIASNSVAEALQS